MLTAEGIKQAGRWCRVRMERDLPRALALESQRIALCVVAYVRAHPGEAHALLEVLEVQDGGVTSVDFEFLLAACASELPAALSPADKANVRAGLYFFQKSSKFLLTI